MFQVSQELLSSGEWAQSTWGIYNYFIVFSCKPNIVPYGFFFLDY